MAQQNDSKLVIIKVARGLTYLVYSYFVIATVFLFLGFLLLLLGANPQASFVHFVYSVASNFLEPFRGMFPPHQITETSYFSAAGLFAIVMYGIGAFFVHAIIDWITLKLEKNQLELQAAYREAQGQAPRKPVTKQTRGNA